MTEEEKDEMAVLYFQIRAMEKGWKEVKEKIGAGKFVWGQSNLKLLRSTIRLLRNSADSLKDDFPLDEPEK